MSVIGALEEVLDEEQRILMSGDFAKLEKLATIKTELAEQLVIDLRIGENPATGRLRALTIVSSQVTNSGDALLR